MGHLQRWNPSSLRHLPRNGNFPLTAPPSSLYSHPAMTILPRLQSHPRPALATAALLLLSLWAPLPAHAQFDLAAARDLRLPNGIRLILLQDSALPLVAVDLYLAGGSSEEPPGAAGVAHCLEHLLFRAPEANRALGEALEEMGADADAQTTRDFTHYYFQLAPADLQRALDLLARAVFDLRLDERTFAPEQKILALELGASYTPQTRLEEILYREAFRNTPYASPPGGTPESIAALNLPQVSDFYRRCYLPARATLVVVGDLNPDALLASATRAFAFRQPAETPPPPSILPPVLQPSIVEEPAAGDAAYVALAFVAPPASQLADVAALDVLSFLFGNTDVGLLHDALVSPGLAAEAGVSFLTHRGPSLFWIWFKVAPSPSSAISAEGALLGRLEALTRQPQPPAKVELAKEIALGVYNFVNSTRAGRAATLGFYATLSRLSDAAAYPRWLAAISPEDLRTAARRYLNPERCLVVRLR